MNAEQIYQWLTCDDATTLNRLWQCADQRRQDNVGDAVHLRGLIEISNHCQRQCSYCGIRAGNSQIERYRMSHAEILTCVKLAQRLGYGTVVLQAGESSLLDSDWVCALLRSIKKECDVAITLSLGERSHEELVSWRQCGADRYLLRFETSNTQLFQQIHPPLANTASDRIALLEKLKTLGYATGSGMLLGIPGQNYHDLVNDLLLIKQLKLHMVGIGPYVPDPATPLGQHALTTPAAADTVPASAALTYRALALARLMAPCANIPSTTAIATLFGSQGQDLGLQRGANVLMPNITPRHYRNLYTIYPAKACLTEADKQGAGDLHQRIRSLGRTVGQGRGDAPIKESANAPERTTVTL